jgi:hypothetical protein
MGARELFQSGLESFVQRFLGEIEVAEQTNQGSKYQARLGAVNRVNFLERMLG